MRVFIMAVLASGSALSAGAQLGTPLWSLNADSVIISSPAVAPDGTIYFAAGSSLYAITNMGSNRWTVAIGYGDSGSPAVAGDGTIYIANGCLHALTPEGSNMWSYPSVGSGSPAIGFDNTIYIVGPSRLHAVSPNGTNLWKYVFAEETPPFPSPVIGSDATIYLGGLESRALYALTTVGTERWIFPADVGCDSPL